MSLPETCPFCGAEPYTKASGEQCRGGDRWVLFSCDTSIYAGQDLRRTQSRKCEDAERARLAARVAELEAREKQRADDDAWADGMGGIRIRIDGAKWNIQYHDCRPFGGSFEAFSTTIGGAIRALREKMEGGAR